ncbi:MAG: helix-turn-helix transcriptional regulator, partial [Solirubrobacteraceae bacterium]
SVGAAAFARAAGLAPHDSARASLLVRAADAAWHAGTATRAADLLAEAPAHGNASVEIDALHGRIAARVGPATHALAILTTAAETAPAEAAIGLLAEAASVCLYAGRPLEMLAIADRVHDLSSADVHTRARFLAATARGMALVVGGNAAEGAREIRAGIALAETAAELQDDLDLLPWLAIGPIFLREPTGRPLLERALHGARERAALGVLPVVLNLIARDQATTDAWRQAESTYGEAIELARETGQEIQLAFGLAGLAWLQARRARDAECHSLASTALELSRRLGLGLLEVWAIAAPAELDLAGGRLESALDGLRAQAQLLKRLEITDPDLSPAPEIVEALTRTGRADAAAAVAAEFADVAEAKGQPWSLARAMRCRGMLAGADADAEAWFARALELHGATPDLFETARTRLLLGERLRRARQRSRARDELREALRAFELLDAPAWTDRASAELEATGETHRGRDPSTRDQLTPQELRIALALAAGRTTREAAAEMFLSPKTIEYHLRHVYRKLGVNTRIQLAQALADPETLRAATAQPLSV